MKLQAQLFAFIGVLFVATAPRAAAETIYFYHQLNGARNLVSLDSSTPGTVSTVALSGFASVNSTLLGLDFNPLDGGLYGRTAEGGADGTTVRINPTTGVLTAVGSATANGGGGARGFDFDPTNGQYRLVTDAGTNRRFDGATGALVQVDGNLNGATTAISNIAYSNNVSGAGSTTLYGIDHTNDQLVQIDGLTGLVTTVGALGVDAPSFGGFDISGTTGKAYAVFFVSNVSGLYTIDLATGAATFQGAIGGGTLAYSGLTVAPAAVPPPSGVPEPSSMALMGIGLGGLVLALRRP